MGSSQFKMHLYEDCHQYNSLIRMVILRPNLLDIKYIRKKLEKYIKNKGNLTDNDSKTYEYYLTQAKNYEWFDYVYKSHPVNYSQNIMPNIDVFVDSCIKQAKFCIKINPIWNLQYDYKKWKNEYFQFLKQCRDNRYRTIVPTLKQDFMWHAHMANHAKYVSDCQNIFGNILNHDDSMTDEESADLFKKQNAPSPKPIKKQIITDVDTYPKYWTRNSFGKTSIKQKPIEFSRSKQSRNNTSYTSNCHTGGGNDCSGCGGSGCGGGGCGGC